MFCTNPSAHKCVVTVTYRHRTKALKLLTFRSHIIFAIWCEYATENRAPDLIESFLIAVVVVHPFHWPHLNKL